MNASQIYQISKFCTFCINCCCFVHSSVFYVCINFVQFVIRNSSLHAVKICCNYWFKNNIAYSIFKCSHNLRTKCHIPRRNQYFVLGRSDIRRKQSEFEIFRCDLSSWECAYSSLITKEEYGVCWCALVIGLKCSYVDLLMCHLIPDQLTGLHKQKASGNKIKI
jgi:hypothetical protein